MKKVLGGEADLDAGIRRHDIFSLKTQKWHLMSSLPRDCCQSGSAITDEGGICYFGGCNIRSYSKVSSKVNAAACNFSQVGCQVLTFVFF